MENAITMMMNNEKDNVKSNRARTETATSATEMSHASSFQESAEEAVAAAAAAETAADVPRWFPRCFGKPILHGKPEALGWLLGMSGQTIGILGVGTFVVPALLYYAKLEAGCEVDIPEGEDKVPECHNKVYGIKPTSLITTAASVLSLIVALLTPLLGAIVDHTRYRRTFGRTLAVLYCCVVFPHIFMSEDTWFPLTISFLMMAMVSLSLSLILHAYLPELTHDENELNDMTKTFTAAPGVGNIIFIIFVMGIAVTLGIDGEEGPTARVAGACGLVVLGTCFTLSWGFLMKPRPAMHELKEGEWLLTAGFKQIGRTGRELSKTNISLLWFYVAVALGDIKPLTGVALTFLSSQQQFSSMDVGIGAVTMLISIVPGAIFSGYMCRRFDPIKSSVLSLICMSITTLSASIFLTGPDQKLQSYVIVACWGIVGGWKLTSTSMLVAAIVPEGQNAELMGFYLFSDTSLSWLAPIIFTAMNEAGYSERVGLSSIVIFFLLALIAYWKMGSYEDCVRAADRLVVMPKHDPAATLVAIAEEEGEASAKNLKQVSSSENELVVQMQEP